jgi:hypothetical protein
MKRLLLVLTLVLLASSQALPLFAQKSAEPDYTQWNRILATYYDPMKGFDYKALKAKDEKTVQNLRQQMAKVDVNKLDRKQQLAYWINVYNMNTVGTVLENYPVKSIRDISTDPIIRLNVFKKERVPVGNMKMSLNDVENEKIRDAFKDPRIHFAINCAARSCPPLRTEAYVGDRLDTQLDDQARKFLNGPFGVKTENKGSKLVVHVTKIMDWFGEDFDKWGGGKTAFIRRYVPADKQKLMDQASGKISLDYDDYNWDLNDWRR